jgi:large subunit ribosomal protein L13
MADTATKTPEKTAASDKKKTPKTPKAKPVSTKSYVAKTGEVKQRWWLIDAKDKVVGRLATEIAMILMGKHRPDYTPHVITGDCVVVINAEKVVFTGKKWEQKRYTHYTGYPGLHVEYAGERLARRPELILSEAVRRMLPKNKLSYKRIANLKVYAGTEHPHQAQQPQLRATAVGKAAK